MTTPPKSISGLTSAAAARVVLFQSGEFVTVPGNVMGLLPTTSVSAFMLTLLDDADATAARTTLGISWELISSQAVASVASIDWTNLSAYRKLRLSGWARPATDAVNAVLRTDTNNGASFDTGASDYSFQRTSAIGGTVATSLSTGTGLTLHATAAIGNATNERIWFEININDFNQATFGLFLYHSGWFDNAGVLCMSHGTGYRNNATARDALQFLFSSGNIDAGHFTLEGIR